MSKIQNLKSATPARYMSSPFHQTTWKISGRNRRRYRLNVAIEKHLDLCGRFCIVTSTSNCSFPVSILIKWLTIHVTFEPASYLTKWSANFYNTNLMSSTCKGAACVPVRWSPQYRCWYENLYPLCQITITLQGHFAPSCKKVKQKEIWLRTWTCNAALFSQWIGWSSRLEWLKMCCTHL